jgi:crotonobetainyl-CoA:carnitine CoA-transferase CaiB-like acyl-CoA transferase
MAITNQERVGESVAVLCLGVPAVDIAIGLNAALGIMFAFKERERSGHGQFVEAALYDCGLSLLHHGVPAAPADPHTKYRGMVMEIGSEYRGVASPVKLSRTPATCRVGPDHPPPQDENSHP